MIIGCFINLCLTTMLWIRRVIWSEAPPAPAGTTNSTGLVGSHAACAGAIRKQVNAAAHSGSRGVFIDNLRMSCMMKVFSG